MSGIPMRLICQEIQLRNLRELFSESEVRRAAFEGTTPEGLAFISTVKDGDIWVSEFDWEEWRNERLKDREREHQQDLMEEAENLQLRHAQKVTQRRQEDSNG
jgi:hypothetical protein